MTIEQIRLDSFRNFDTWAHAFHPRVNAIIGPNGAGKTSILESIYMLGYGRSFRHRSSLPLIKHEHSTLIIQAECLDQEQKYHMAIQKNHSNQNQLRENKATIKSLSQFQYKPAICYMDSDLHRQYNRQSTERRKILDWGVFHHEPTYLSIWRRYQHTLKQRNASLNQCYRSEDITIWDQGLSELASQIHQYRSTYYKKLLPFLQSALEKICHFSDEISLEYSPGWDTSLALSDVLRQNFALDKQVKSTTKGSHRADFNLLCHGKKISEYRSQGEQKLILYGLKLAQILLLLNERDQPIIVLIDDIIAEIDLERQMKIIHFLKQLPLQLFFTCTHFDGLDTCISTSECKQINLI